MKLTSERTTADATADHEPDSSYELPMVLMHENYVLFRWPHKSGVIVVGVGDKQEEDEQDELYNFCLKHDPKPKFQIYYIYPFQWRERSLILKELSNIQVQLGYSNTRNNLEESVKQRVGYFRLIYNFHVVKTITLMKILVFPISSE